MVPNTGANAPYSPATGSQFLLVKKPQPKCCMLGMAPMIKVIMMPTKLANTKKAKNLVRLTNNQSSLRWVASFCCN